ncbi:Calpain-9-like [Homarus americanus]|uniref:Calpain-9-like n=1 Tax=Homarus americanus TaxID=6706 RepID=A0A8J5N8E1_HOMAM|nr:Calpain-9-like [Homarus americanus]
MGCGVSVPESTTPEVPQDGYFKESLNGAGLMPPQVCDGRSTIILTSEDTITVVTSPTVVRAARLVYTQEVLVTVTEEAVDKPKTGEEGAFELPESEFEDGRLGVIRTCRYLTVEEHYCDDEFPAHYSSLFFSSRIEVDVQWKRPFELQEEPHLFVDGASRRDVVQGELSDCWFLSSCAAVARTPKLLERSMDAMVDLTGGLAERLEIAEMPDKMKLYKLLNKASKNGAFITASRKGDWKMSYKTDEHGLVDGHAYTVSGVATVSHQDMGHVHLVRVRNPWANGAEWNGEWADSDDKWKGVSDYQMKKLGRTNIEDGEFWMSYKDFCDQFEEVSVCTIGPDFDKDGTVDHVEQEHRRSHRHLGVKMQQIGVVLYRTEDPEHRLPATHFFYNYEEGTSGVYINFREVLCRVELNPGHYVIIPATFLPDSPGHFMVRVYSPKSFDLKMLPNELSLK